MDEPTRQQDTGDDAAKKKADIEQGYKDVNGGPLKASLEASQKLVEQMNAQQKAREEAGVVGVEVGDYTPAQQQENREKDGEPTPAVKAGSSQ